MSDKECIYREDAIAAVANYLGATSKTAALAAECILKPVPAAPVLEVIYCKDCDVPHNEWTGCPKLGGLVPPPLWFCAGAEPKKEATEPICGATKLPCIRCQPGPCGNRV